MKARLYAGKSYATFQAELMDFNGQLFFILVFPEENDLTLKLSPEGNVLNVSESLEQAHLSNFDGRSSEFAVPMEVEVPEDLVDLANKVVSSRQDLEKQAPAFKELLEQFERHVTT